MTKCYGVQLSIKFVGEKLNESDYLIGYRQMHRKMMIDNDLVIYRDTAGVKLGISLNISFIEMFSLSDVPRWQDQRNETDGCVYWNKELFKAKVIWL